MGVETFFIYRSVSEVGDRNNMLRLCFGELRQARNILLLLVGSCLLNKICLLFSINDLANRHSTLSINFGHIIGSINYLHNVVYATKCLVYIIFKNMQKS